MAERRFDPERRGRIIDAALDVIAEHGVAGASHRKIAARADVPLGSMTYHFSGMEELLREAFTRFSATISARFEARLAQADTLEAARDAVVDLVHADLNQSARELVLTQELDALIEGSFLHAALDTEQHDRAVTAEAVTRITTPRPVPGR